MTYSLKNPDFDMSFEFTPEIWEAERNRPTLEQEILQRDARRMVQLEGRVCTDKELAELETLKKWYGMMPQKARLVQRPISN